MRQRGRSLASAWSKNWLDTATTLAQGLCTPFSMGWKRKGIYVRANFAEVGRFAKSTVPQRVGEKRSKLPKTKSANCFMKLFKDAKASTIAGWFVAESRIGVVILETSHRST